MRTQEESLAAPRAAPGLWRSLIERLRACLRLPAGDLLHDVTYRRLWSSILISSFGGQVTMLALPLTAAVLLHATPTQMGLLTAIEIAPFVLLSLPAGVWLDRVRKLPVYIYGELTIALLVAGVPLAHWLGWLSMPWMYATGFLLGSVYVVAGSAAQIVLTQVVTRDRLVEAHAKNALASSGAEVAGPGVAGALIKLVGAPLALLVDALLLVISVGILRGIRVHERIERRKDQHFWLDLKAGLRFVVGTPLLLALSITVGLWQMFYHGALVVQILFATRTLGLEASQVGLSYVVLGVGTVGASVFGNRISRRLGPGPCLLMGIAICGLGWGQLALAPANTVGIAAFAFMLLCFGFGATLIFINFLALRQAVTPAQLLGRMTSAMRWLTTLAAAPGALFAGWLGEHVGLRAALAFSGGGALLLALLAWRLTLIRTVSELPATEDVESTLGVEAGELRDVVEGRA
ncbi:MFS transporter [Rivibacter subsaxonicus]|uniref:MFS transporter n=1 Tax=Rivibacter subsaxonicus TaxID=457575 RepID=A0A4Q7VZB7_9BURK|nr:MFS transporter [Rivibacter subsaxonicus]RZU02232.1 MFS transporter [Rivibacter subsaxonicus]